MCGRSTCLCRGDGQPPRDTVDALADWLLAGVPRGAVVVGHSLCGAVAQVAALKDADALCGISLVVSSARPRVAPFILEAVAQTAEDRPLPLDFAFLPGTPRLVIYAKAVASRGVPAVTAVDYWTACYCFHIHPCLSSVKSRLLSFAWTMT
jgi:Predicted hydrolases or acyltransferases (alpha/beta hydrolase superfamily)